MMPSLRAASAFDPEPSMVSKMNCSLATPCCASNCSRATVPVTPTPILEEAVIGRIKDLSTDRSLVAELVRSMGTGQVDKFTQQRALLAIKEQERRKLEQKANNLYEAISEESDRDLRLILSERAKEAKALLSQVELAILEMKQDLARTDNVVDISGVIGLIKEFRDGAFDAQPVAAQSEILKSRVRKIVVRENGVHIEIFGENPGSFAAAGNDSTDTQARSTRSGVLTVSKLVRQGECNTAFCPPNKNMSSFDS